MLFLEMVQLWCCLCSACRGKDMWGHVDRLPGVLCEFTNYPLCSHMGTNIDCTGFLLGNQKMNDNLNYCWKLIFIGQLFPNLYQINFDCSFYIWCVYRSVKVGMNEDCVSESVSETYIYLFLMCGFIQTVNHFATLCFHMHLLWIMFRAAVYVWN